mmetsp:Transcript_48678/g.78419  ORF Transcript_48678/g.78419 Transcript_48678/m.78419 type:complete len:267 (-) Transcript_48678:49-849(-)
MTTLAAPQLVISPQPFQHPFLLRRYILCLILLKLPNRHCSVLQCVAVCCSLLRMVPPANPPKFANARSHEEGAIGYARTHWQCDGLGDSPHPFQPLLYMYTHLHPLLYMYSRTDSSHHPCTACLMTSIAITSTPLPAPVFLLPSASVFLFHQQSRRHFNAMLTPSISTFHQQLHHHFNVILLLLLLPLDSKIISTIKVIQVMCCHHVNGSLSQQRIGYINCCYHLLFYLPLLLPTAVLLNNLTNLLPNLPILFPLLLVVPYLFFSL